MIDLLPEHLAAIEIMKLKHILILQNKIDLIKEAQVSVFLFNTVIFLLMFSSISEKNVITFPDCVGST